MDNRFRLAAGVSGKEVDGGADAHLAQRFRHGRVIRTIEPGLNLIQVDFQRLDSAP